MRIVTIVGIRKSGKTSTVEALLGELARRGRSAGTCKTIFCPTFSMDDPKSNTARHTRAGSRLVCSRAQNETALLYPQQLALSRIAAFYADMDYLLLEGDYRAPVPRIVCAHTQKDALPRINDRTICCAGRVSTQPELLPVPVINALTDPGTLLTLIDEAVSDEAPSTALDEQLPPVEGVLSGAACQCGCHHNEQKQAAVRVTVGGRELELTPEQLATVQAWAGEAQDG